jgi:hypothetical protein
MVWGVDVDWGRAAAAGVGSISGGGWFGELTWIGEMRREETRGGRKLARGGKKLDDPVD